MISANRRLEAGLSQAHEHLQRLAPVTRRLRTDAARLSNELWRELLATPAHIRSSHKLALLRTGLSQSTRRLAGETFSPIALQLSRLSRTPATLRQLPFDRFRGSPARGRDVVAGRFALAGSLLDLPDSQPWSAPNPSSPQFRRALHSFVWLADLCALANVEPGEAPAARQAALTFITGWLDADPQSPSPAWHPRVAGRRLISWLSSGTLLAEAGDTAWRGRFAQSVAQQARFVALTHELLPSTAERLTALIALVLARLSLGTAGPTGGPAAAALARELKRQILPDGGHASRSPAIQFDLLADLLVLKEAFQLANATMPKELAEAVAGMMPMLRFFEVGDGTLAAFHGSGRQDPASVRAVLEADEAQSRPLGYAPHSGFHRLAAESTLIIVDAGAAPAPAMVGETHAGSLAFELASGGQRIVINCGRPATPDHEEERAARTAASHSTLVLGSGKTPPPTASPWQGLLLSKTTSGLAQKVEARRHEEQAAGYGGTWLDMSHDGYATAYGRRHVRRLYVQERGGDVRGEDRIEPIVDTGAAPSVPFALRFHLHPDVTVTVANGENGAVLTLPSGEVWRFQCKGGPVSLADSICYAPEGERVTRQIVIKGTAGPEPVSLRWAFKRQAIAAAATTQDCIAAAGAT
jgi:uncharacterized heparinase superfamily protein